MTRHFAAILILLAVWPGSVSAQVRPFVFGQDERVSFKPDGSYFFNHTDPDLVFEAQVAPDLQIVGNVAQQLTKVLSPTSAPTVRAYAVFATPMFRIRMFDEDSNPVRTPSYMPKVSAQVAWFKSMARDDQKGPERYEQPVRMLLLHFVPFGHHSNGQNGCLFVGQERPECEPKQTSVPYTAALNTNDGSFSTNYLRAGVGYRRMYPTGKNDEIEDPASVTKREWGVGATVEFNPKGYVGGALSDQLRLTYGATRFEIDADYAKRDLTIWKLTCGRAQASATFRYIHGAEFDLKYGGAAEVFCLPKRWGGSGLFLRYVNGQDYYNINFFQRIQRLQFGVTFDQMKFLMFALPSTG